MVIFYHVGSTDFESLADISFESQRWLWLAIFMSLAIKKPLLPVLIWLSRAHVEAPVGQEAPSCFHSEISYLRILTCTNSILTRSKILLLTISTNYCSCYTCIQFTNNTTTNLFQSTSCLLIYCSHVSSGYWSIL